MMELGRVYHVALFPNRQNYPRFSVVDERELDKEGHQNAMEKETVTGKHKAVATTPPAFPSETCTSKLKGTLVFLHLNGTIGVKKWVPLLLPFLR